MASAESLILVVAVAYPFGPSMPPKISIDQAVKFAWALAKGASNRGKLAWSALSDKAPELIWRPRGSSKITA